MVQHNKMSVKSDLRELEKIRLEIKRIALQRKNLKEQEKKIEERIRQFLIANNLPGVKDGGVAIKLEEKEARKPKKAKERDAEVLEILAQTGVENPQEVLDRILEARKGEVVTKQQVKLHTY